MKIYTKKGDSGETSLYGGDRVSKNSPRAGAFGTVDELNSLLGLILAGKPAGAVGQILHDLQQKLFVLGADLATPQKTKARIERIGHDDIRQLETHIDRLEEKLPDLKHFILPGGKHEGALLHMARTVCRRAERAVVACSQQEPVSAETIIYLNRLSDLLFVLARTENHLAGISETEWIPGKPDAD